jgi:hypothetical protein
MQKLSTKNDWPARITTPLQDGKTEDTVGCAAIVIAYDIVRKLAILKALAREYQLAVYLVSWPPESR